MLEFGNRLNTAGVRSKRKVGAFSLESLLKLNQAKAFDKKTTFLHYVVMIVRKNNELLLRFQDDLPTVLKADKVYWDQCLADLEEVENQLENVRRISLYQARIQQELKHKRRNPHEDENDSLGDVSLSLEEEVESLRATQIGLFTLGAIKKVSALRDKVEVTKEKFSRLLEYFGEEEKKLQPHELFNVISVFCRDFLKAKEEVFANLQKKMREDRKKAKHGTPTGKPPAPPDRANHRQLRASSMQPNMSKVIRDFQRSEHDPSRQGNQESPPRSKKKILDERKGLSPRSSKKKFEERKGPASPRSSKPKYEVQPDAVGSQDRRPDMRKIQKNANQTHERSEMEVPPEPLPPRMQESGHLQNVPAERPRPSQPHATSSSGYSSTTRSANAMRQKARMRRQRQMQVTSGRATPLASNTTSAALARAPQTDRMAPESPPPPGQMTNDGSSPRNNSPRSTMRQRRRHLEAKKQNSPTSHTQPTTGMDWPAPPNMAAG